MIHCLWRIYLGFFPGLLQCLMRSKSRELLFPNEKRMNLKVPVSPISDLWKTLQMSPGHEFIGKKARESRHFLLKLWISEASCSERDSIFCISAFKKAVLAICW